MKELLICLCRFPFDEKNRDTLSKLLRGVQDWNELVRLINAHGIIALAAYNIKEAGLEKIIPAEAMAVLENGQRQSVVRNLWLKERWGEVNEILNNAGIKHILLKGMALENTIYKSKGLRQMNDNDILVKQGDALKAWLLLQNEGFTINIPKSPIHICIMKKISQHLPSLYKEGYSLEIHTNLFDYKTSDLMDYYDPFENPVEIHIDIHKALILPQEVHLRYLIKHFERHTRAGECQLRLFSDILLLNKESSIKFPDQFIFNPYQRKESGYRKSAYKAKVLDIHPKYRLLFILGDLFPSIKWMKERYNCEGIKVLLYYPHRFGKLLWLL